jgi:hypothetical protein
MASGHARFINVAFFWKNTPKSKELEPLFNTAMDWYRYAPNCWLLWTTNGPEVWFPYLKKYLGEGDDVFIAELNLTHVPETYTGWYQQSFWNWIKKHRA